MSVEQGICPNCGEHKGRVGDGCPNALCSAKGYHLIPVAWYEAAQEYSTRKSKPMDTMLGRMIANYLLIGKLGEGGMGAVYLALQHPLDREVALKLISGMELTPEARARFEREARTMAALEHPNIVKLYDYGVGTIKTKSANERFQVPYMAMEYVRHGKPLARAFRDVQQENNGRIPGHVVLHVFTQVLNAIAEAHSLGLVHRDMKPDNILITRVRGNPLMVKVLDFGLAKAVSDVTGFVSDVTHTGAILGTPMYMAPEQAMTGKTKDGKKVVLDGRVDLYSVAVMLYEVFTGRTPFDADTSLAILMQKTDPGYDPLAFPEALVLPSNLRAFLAKGMARDRDDRFSSADEMLEALQAALAGQAITGRGLVATGDTSSKYRPVTPVTPSREQQPTRIDGHASDTDTPSSSVGAHPRPSRKGLYIAGVIVLLAALAGAFWAFGRGTPRSKDMPKVVRIRTQVPRKAGLAKNATKLRDKKPRPRPQTPVRAARTHVIKPVPGAPAHKPAKPASYRAAVVSAGSKNTQIAKNNKKTPRKAVVPAPVQHNLRIVTSPPHARVRINGRPVGHAPMAWKFVVKKPQDKDRPIRIHVQAPGYVSRTLVIKQGIAAAKSAVHIQLKKQVHRTRVGHKKKQKQRQKKGKKPNIGVPLI